MANLGFVGLGAMGSRITKRLLAKGHAVSGYDLFPAKQQELVAMGGKWASSPRAVCEAADTTFVMVTNTAALEGASQGPDGLLTGLGAGSEGAGEGRRHARRAGLGQHLDGGIRQAVDHGRWTPRDVRQRQAAARG